MSQNATTIDQLIADILKERRAKREEFKKAIQTLVDENKLSYADALRAMQVSCLFEVSSYILERTGEAGEIFEMYNEDREYKYETTYFTEIVDWIEWSEGEVQEALDAAGISDPYKALYDYAMKTNYIGYIFDW